MTRQATARHSRACWSVTSADLIKNQAPLEREPVFRFPFFLLLSSPPPVCDDLNQGNEPCAENVLESAVLRNHVLSADIRGERAGKLRPSLTLYAVYLLHCFMRCRILAAIQPMFGNG